MRLPVLKVPLSQIDDAAWDALADAARAASDHAYAPFSRFKVGAALLTSDGQRFAGCNVENRSFGLALCAERSAVAAWVAAGSPGTLKAAAVHAATSPPARPCGLCRETLAEFAEELPILLANDRGEREIVLLSEIFPQPFRWPG
jgi:cytidine deaminase